MSFEQRSHKLVTLAVESFGRLGREGSEFIDQLATSVVGGRDRGAMAKKGICKERFFTDSLSDLSGRYFTPSSPVKTRITGPSSDKREEGRGGGADADSVGLSHRYRVGNYKSWKEEGK